MSEGGGSGLGCALTGLAGMFVLVLALPLGGAMISSANQTTADTPQAGGGAFNSSTVPADYVGALKAAGTRCEAISTPLLAAQIKQESGFNANATSPVGAMGPSQFMPGTWAMYGKDYNGNGVASAREIEDAVGSQADYMCTLSKIVAGYVERGQASGDFTELTLAAYNAGPGNVLTFGGIPPFAETQGYVRKIIDSSANYMDQSVVLAGGGASNEIATATGAAIVAHAQKFLGTRYAWGGGTFTGPSYGIGSGSGTHGFDCSGLTLYAVYQATGKKLPHAARIQRTMGTPVSRADMQPGDLIAFRNSSGNWHHIGIYYGNGKMLHAPNPSTVVKIIDLNGSYYEKETWEIRRIT
ncbi:NlpC/P60 family protein [Paeniglutamicibacter sp. NPDC091659]|uniref:C40 family peptidase n=1 Tax=Paeniglutamicibacter sp. NPDC091659 TaxID=3364389 RepID=UPI00382251E9